VRFVWWRLAVLTGAAAAGVGLFLLSQRTTDFILAIAFFPLPMASVLFFLAARDRDQRAQQRHRDRRVLLRLEQMRDGTDAFFLYLRPFASTGGVRVLRRVARRKRSKSSYYGRDPRFNPGPGYQYRLDVVWNDLETLLAMLLEPYAPLVGLGRPGEQFGAGRVPADEATWQDLVRDLADNAWLLFLLPSEDQGTRWELDLVMGTPRLLRKTVFIVPGSGDASDYVDRRAWGPPVRLHGGLTYRMDGASFGAAHEPLRSNDELRRGAIECLERVGARPAARQAGDSSTGALIMLGKDRRVRLFHSLQGYASSWTVNPLDLGPVFRLDLGTLDHALAQARATTVGPRSRASS
jgi:hypothetical protein